MVKRCCVYKCNNQYNAAAKVKGTKENEELGLKPLTGEIGYQMNIVVFVLNISLMGGTVWNPQITIMLQQYLHTNLQHQVHLRFEENPGIVAQTYQRIFLKNAYISAVRSNTQEQLEKAIQDQRREQLNKSFNVFANSDYCVQEQEWEVLTVILYYWQTISREVKQLKEELRKYKWSVDKISDNDSATRFILLKMTYWTGESSTPSVKAAHHLVISYVVTAVMPHLSSINQLLAVITTWICLLYEELKARDIINRTKPSQFKKKYPTTRIILDCTKIFTQRSFSLTKQRLTFLNY
ncbi:hypothetical protein KUTeg_021902 [Tegillarca granosa]|uniref:Uncharacterized protein n=1 Tax=Tegillarca granosa TaxID=220873 RepID=A0ABQ9E4P7_TEGGR|nr:hypothetical protein KUTeg_021902 [Tegillarca granosa]